jgi:hypothetical protein
MLMGVLDYESVNGSQEPSKLEMKDGRARNIKAEQISF